MLKNTLLLIISITALSANAAVTDSDKITTETLSGQALVEENFENVSALKEKVNQIEDAMSKFQICEAKNRIYLGANVSGADSDDCVDIQSVPVKRKSRKPAWVGFVANLKNGQLIEDSGVYNTSDTSTAWGRMRADFSCNALKSGARALTANDIKYVYDDLTTLISSGEFNHTTKSKYVWLFDAWYSYVDDNTTLPQYSMGKESATDCDSWTSQTGNGVVLEVDTTGSNYYIKQNIHSCSDEILIGCVE